MAKNIKISIFKPGTKLGRRLNKTNLQIHELQHFRALIAKSVEEHCPYGYSANLAIFDHYYDALTADLMFVFCHHKDHAQIFKMLLVDLINEPKKHLILVSNDVRLPFAHDEDTERLLSEVIKHHKVTCWTNATRFLNDYHTVVFKGMKGEIKIVSQSLHTIVLRNLNDSGLVATPSTRKDACFFGMKFNDYDDKRKSKITEIQASAENNGVTMHCYGDMPESRGIIDASVVSEILQVYNFTPVLLERSYEYFGLIPNRVSEALSAGTTPIFIVDDPEKFKSSAFSPHSSYSMHYRSYLSESAIVQSDFIGAVISMKSKQNEQMQLNRRLLSIANNERHEFKASIGATIREMFD